MKILHLSSANSFGGGERHLTDLVRALASRGHEMSVALTPDAALARQLSFLPARNIVALPMRHLHILTAAQKLTRFVRERDTEIIHAHMARDYPLAALIAMLAGRQVSLVLTRHVLFPLGNIHRLTFARAARIIAVSAPVANALRAQHLCPDAKIVCINNGIELSSFSESRQERESFRRQIGAAEDQLLIGISGELSRIKGQEDFLRAAALIADEFPRALFLLAGADPTRDQSERLKLERLTNKLKLQHRVRFLGWIEPITPFLAALDLFVSTSRSESFGLAMVEAMASKLPIIATRTAGAMEILNDAQTGLLTPCDDPPALATAMRQLLGDQNQRRTLGARARQSARQRFSLEHMVSETERLYSLLSDK